MNQDAFSKCHPAMNFLYFAAAMAFSMVFLHPAYLLAGTLGAGIYYAFLKGKQIRKMLAGLLPLFMLLSVINPLFNTRGENVLFYIFGNPYTLEALYHGAAVAGVLVEMLLWFGCYNQVMTGDKFSSLFGNVLPSVSLLLVMIFRMVPNLIGKARQIAGARTSIGLAGGSTLKEKLRSGMTVLSALTSWVLEGSIITADSMRSRGYGTAKRTTFSLYRFSGLDWILLVIIATLLFFILSAALSGSTAATYTPVLSITPITGKHLPGFLAYCLFCFIPSVLHLWEALLWHISISRI